VLYETARHESLQSKPWDSAVASRTIERIYADTVETFSDESLWPVHPLDWEGDAPPMNMLYLGAAGVIWAIQFLERVDAVDGKAHDFTPLWPTLFENNQSALSMFNMGTASYWMGDTGILLAQWLDDPSDTITSALIKEISSNTDHPALDFMWGAPGTMVAALAMLERSQDEQFADLFRLSAKALWSSLEQADELDCKLWTQSLYGMQSKHVCAGHGFAGNVFPIISGRNLLAGTEWGQWRDVIIQTVTTTALVEDDYANWPQSIGQARPGRTELLVQYCHGAPGMVTCLADFPEASIDSLLVQAGELTWKAGPLTKGAGLCHGTAGNGYAFLKLYERTKDEVWLERARAFAMHAISQFEAHIEEYGRGRYSLWTGDQGLAVYLWSCLKADHRFPTLDLF